MVVIERRHRKGPILTPSSLRCLASMPTINITEGCAHGCTYCYTQGYSSYPGKDRIVLFDNIPELVRSELPRKRQRPRRVYFSPSSDAFQPPTEVQDITYETMAILLEAGVEVAFLTKGTIGERFLSLFSAASTSVFAQVGITTLDERLWHALEPGTASPIQRLQFMEKLNAIGIPTEARLDPLIPGLTDTADNLSPLLAELSKRGVQRVAASFLFFRPTFASKLAKQLDQIAGCDYSSRTWIWQRLSNGVAGGQMAGPEERRLGFRRLEALASRHAISVHICVCKNSDLTSGSGCGIAGPASSPPAWDAPLWRVSEP